MLALLGLLVACALAVAWLVYAIIREDHTMMEGGNAWAWSGRGAALAQNYWQAINDRRATEEELDEAAAAAAAAAGGGAGSGVAAPLSAQLSCLGCGKSKGDFKTCGKCKLAAYCSRECQQKHWQRHKPQCHLLVEAEHERQTKGARKPAPPTPDPPLTLGKELIFSRDGYASLLEAHVTNRAGYHRAMQLQEQSRQADKGTTNGGSGTAIGSDDDETVDSESAGGPQDTNSAANRGAGGDHVAATAAVASASPASEGTGSNSAEDVGVSKDNGPAGPIQAPDGSWRWEWSQPPSADLLTPRRPTGIFNTGNSCYAASAIQALLATPALGEWLRSRSHCTCCPAPDDKEDAPAVSKGAVSSWCPACELSELAAEAAASAAAAAAAAGARSRGHSSPLSPQPVNAGRLTKQVARLGRTLRPGRQEDAHELLVKLLEALAEVQVAGAGGRTVMREKARAAARAVAAAAAATAANGEDSAPEPPQPVWRGDETSLVHHCLGGYLRRATICSCCGHVSQSHEAVLSLEVHLSTRVYNVEAGLQAYFEDEVLDEGNEYRCERCRQLVCATRRVRLEAAPNVLVIALKRFTAGGGRAAKNNKPVALKLRLDLAPHMAPEPLDDGPVTYRLYAVVQHTGLVAPGAFGGAVSGSAAASGTLNMGHYVAVVRGGDGAWYCCDDDEVTQVRESDVAAITDAYLLFYERESPRLPPQPQPSAPNDEPGASGSNGGGEALEDADKYQELAAPASDSWEVLLSPVSAAAPGWHDWLAPDAGAPAASVAETAGAGKLRSGSKAKGHKKQAGGGSEATEGSSASSQRAVVCPRFALLPPRRQGDSTWQLQVEMPGVRSRDVKLAVTSPPAQQQTSQQAGGAEGAGEGAASLVLDQVRLRIWAAGWYNLDLVLQLRRQSVQATASDRWEVVVCPATEGSSDEGATAGATGLEVLQPVWNNSRKVLKVPLRLH